MKKKLLILLLVALLPVTVFAKSFLDDYNTTGLKETVAAEGLELLNKDYKENDKQAVIYLFRGQGCSHCHEFVEFLNSISKEYGNYFRLVAFEVWQDNTNSALLSKIAAFNGDDPNNTGVPYFVIGEKVFNMGYGASMADDVKEAIMKQYNNPGYDLIEAYQKSLNKDTGTSSVAVIFWNAFFIVAATVAVIIVSNNNTKRILEAVDKKGSKK